MNVTVLRSCLMSVSWRGSSSLTPLLTHALMHTHRNILIQTMCQSCEYPSPWATRLGLLPPKKSQSQNPEWVPVIVVWISNMTRNLATECGGGPSDEEHWLCGDLGCFELGQVLCICPNCFEPLLCFQKILSLWLSPPRPGTLPTPSWTMVPEWMRSWSSFLKV